MIVPHPEHPMKRLLPLIRDRAAVYIFLLPFSLFLAAGVWAELAPDRLYKCTDPLLPIFVPPFVHAGSDDVYLIAAWRVWFIWAALIILGLVLPALVIWALRPRERTS